MRILYVRTELCRGLQVAVNQDAAAHPPRLVSQATNSSAGAPPTTATIVSQVFARPIGHRGQLAVVLFNRDETATELSVGWADLGLAAGARMAVRDVANRSDLPPATGKLSLDVARHDVRFVMLTPSERQHAHRRSLKTTEDENAAPHQHLKYMMTYDWDPSQHGWINVLSGDDANRSTSAAVFKQFGIAAMPSPCGVFRGRPCAPPPPPAVNNGTCEHSTSKHGQVFGGGSLAVGASAATASVCAARCCANAACAGWAFVAPGGHCDATAPSRCCWLKAAGGEMTPWPDGVGGQVMAHAGHPPTPAPPPSRGGLLPGWKAALRRFTADTKQMLATKAAIGVFLGHGTTLLFTLVARPCHREQTVVAAGMSWCAAESRWPTSPPLSTHCAEASGSRRSCTRTSARPGLPPWPPRGAYPQTCP